MNQSKLLTARIMTCSRCSAGIDRADVFCRKCGASQVPESRFASALENPLLKAELVLLVALGTFLVSGAIWCVKKPVELPAKNVVASTTAAPQKTLLGLPIADGGAHAVRVVNGAPVAPRSLVSTNATVGTVSDSTVDSASGSLPHSSTSPSTAALDSTIVSRSELDEISRLVAISVATPKNGGTIDTSANDALRKIAKVAMKSPNLRKLRGQVRADIAAQKLADEAAAKAAEAAAAESAVPTETATTTGAPLAGTNGPSQAANVTVPATAGTNAVGANVAASKVSASTPKNVVGGTESKTAVIESTVRKMSKGTVFSSSKNATSSTSSTNNTGSASNSISTQSEELTTDAPSESPYPAVQYKPRSFAEVTSLKTEPGKKPSLFTIEPSNISEIKVPKARKKSADDVAEYNHALAEFLQHQTESISSTAGGDSTKEPPSYEEWLKSGKAKF